MHLMKIKITSLLFWLVLFINSVKLPLFSVTWLTVSVLQAAGLPGASSRHERTWGWNCQESHSGRSERTDHVGSWTGEMFGHLIILPSRSRLFSVKHLEILWIPVCPCRAVKGGPALVELWPLASRHWRGPRWSTSETPVSSLSLPVCKV